MPNWCFNEVTITGKKENLKKIERVLKKYKKDGVFFDRIHPIPEELRNTTSPFANSARNFEDIFKPGYKFCDWYDWCIVNWGTKWDVELLGIEIRKNKILLGFDSAWSPPISFFLKFSEIFEVKVEHLYREESREFIGKSVQRNGKVILDEATWDVTRESVEYFGFDPEDVFDEDEDE